MVVLGPPPLLLLEEDDDDEGLNVFNAVAVVLVLLDLLELLLELEFDPQDAINPMVNATEINNMAVTIFLFKLLCILLPLILVGINCHNIYILAYNISIDLLRNHGGNV